MDRVFGQDLKVIPIWENGIVAKQRVMVFMFGSTAIGTKANLRIA